MSDVTHIVLPGSGAVFSYHDKTFLSVLDLMRGVTVNAPPYLARNLPQMMECEFCLCCGVKFWL